MAQYTIETLTILAAAAIGAILAIYIAVLKKNGWLGRSSKFYRCPNPECKKIFEKPIELKDLSETLARSYPACPHCGVDLEPVFGASIRKMAGLKTKTHLQKTGTRNNDSTLKSRIEKTDNIQRIEFSEKILKTAETKPKIASDNKKQWSLNFGKNPSSQFKEERKAFLKAQENRASNIKYESSNRIPEGCAHFFGYLRNLPKGSAVPDACYSCSKMVDCYVETEDVANT